MKLIIEINCTNDAFAFSDGTLDISSAGMECGAILRRLASDLVADESRGILRDTNGNTCGHFEFKSRDY